ncbi:MAG: DUF3987 domain-containing protein [Pseudomonadota bacterium]
MIERAAQTLLKAGFSVIPTGSDKRPTVATWKPFQDRLMTKEEAQKYFINGARLAVVGGRISGNLECLDIDDPTTYQPFLDLLEMRFPNLPGKLLKRKTPSGGYHLIYRSSSQVPGNLKLACDQTGKVRIETRGEGGYFLSPPSEGYCVISGSLTDCPTLCPAEVEAIHTIAQAFDERQPMATARINPKASDNVLPGSQFNDSHQVTEILEAQGWKEDKRTTAGIGWTRPGKNTGVSGVLLGNGKFYVWSSNAAPLEPGRSYDAFGLFTMYHHGGDFSAASRDLLGQGFGTGLSGEKDRARQPGMACDVAIMPKPLPDELLPVTEFDFTLLPESMRAWAQDICERMQCPPDFVGVGILTSLAAVLGRKIGIRPQAQTDWTVVPNIWAMVVGRPGVLKSPALEATLGPLNRLVAQQTDIYNDALAAFKKGQIVAKLRAEAGEKIARKMLDKSTDAEVLALLAGDESDAPVLRRYIANDTSPASLGELLRQNSNGLLVYRDELVSLLKGLDREDQAEGRGFYLTAWNGDSAYTFDRIGRGLNLHIEAVCLSVLGGTQPGRLAEYIRQAVKGGAADDGLIQRFGMMVWPDTVGTWKNVDRFPDSEAKSRAFKTFHYLDKIDPATIGTHQDKDIDGNSEGIPYLRFDSEGLDMFLEWRTDLETRLRGGDLLPALESHFAKYRKLIPSLALIIHLADGGSGPVGKMPTLKALAWGDYLETHARRAYGAISQPEVSTAKAILKRIKKGDLPASFSGRDVWRPGWAMLSDRDQVTAALQLLVDYDHLQVERKETGGRPATIYHVVAGGQV